MAEKTLQDHLVDRLDKPVKAKGGGFATDPIDGHQLTATEAIAIKMMEKALAGDVKAAQFIMQLEAANKLRRK